MDKLTLEEAKELVKKHTDPLVEKGQELTVEHLNECIVILRNHEYFARLDNTNLVISSVIQDSEGYLVYNILGSM